MNAKRIMIVEDEMVVAEDIRRCLEKAGFVVSASLASGEAAVAAAASIACDLVLMDIRLAGAMDGIEAAAAILAQVDVPVVYLTAYSDEAILDRAKLTEPFGYLVKPFDRRELCIAIDMAIHKHRRLAERLHNLRAASPKPNPACLPLGFGFEYSCQRECLLYFGREIGLTKKEHRFIHLLVENLDRTVSYRKIESYVWGGTGVDPNNLRIFLWRLRSKIGRELVKNTAGLGYRIDKPAAE